MSIQQQLPLFEPSSFEQILKQAKVSALSVELGKRLRSRWYVKECRMTKRRKLFLPATFEHAPVEVKKGLIEWAQLPIRTHKNSATTLRRKQLELQAFAFLEQQGVKPRRRSIDPLKLEQNTLGTRYDLREVFDSINERFFDGALQSALRWGGWATTTSYMTKKRDPDGDIINLITIAGVYDHPDVPRFAVESIMYHEMLHIAEPPQRRNGRNRIHTPAFQAREKAFPWYVEWTQWEKKEMARIVRWFRRKRKR